jgi:formylglycine-generating enzyme required for sulfatase activity
MKKIFFSTTLILGLFTTSCLCAQVVAEKQDVTPPSKFTNSIGMKFVWIPPTSEKGFMMGAGIFEWYYAKAWYLYNSKMLEESIHCVANSDEFPQHKVILTDGFWLQTTEVTQKQWETVMRNNPCRYKGDNVPVYNVSWDDAQEFITKLNLLEKTYTYRLPTEAEWEYACRAGTSTRYYWGDDSRWELHFDYCWSSGNSFHTPHPVAEKKPNPWGLYDMIGNLSEWCLDEYNEKFYRTKEAREVNPWNCIRYYGNRSKSGKIIRGGNHDDYLYECRSATRNACEKSYKGNFIGFRVLRTENKKEQYEDEISRPKKINAVGMEFIRIPSTGQTGFLMGAPEDTRFRKSPEQPQHKVVLTKSFWLQTTEVTQQQWRLVMGKDPITTKRLSSYEHLEGDSLPVTNVSWDEVQEFIKKLNELDNRHKYRLPIEAEWEYACRAGTTTLYYWGDEINSDYCNTWIDGRNLPLPVGRKKPNRWGLYDMIGNVSEWCQDLYSERFLRCKPLCRIIVTTIHDFIN